jgi:hypothetical protein
MSFQIEVNVFDIEKNKYQWIALHPSRGKAYEYKTREEAERILNICYGDKGGVKITEVK